MKTSPSKTANHQNVDKEAATGEDERGDLLIIGFWTAGTNCILDVCVTAAVCATHFLCLRGSRVPAHNVSTQFSCNGKTELVWPCMNGPSYYSRIYHHPYYSDAMTSTVATSNLRDSKPRTHHSTRRAGFKPRQPLVAKPGYDLFV